MIYKRLIMLVVIVSVGLMISGCPKKTAVKMEPSSKGSEQSEIRQVPRTEGEETKREDAKKEFEGSLVTKKHLGMKQRSSEVR